MSDPIAVSILAKLTGWYPFDGNLNDAHGSNSITESTHATYTTGLKGQQVASGSYGVHTLAPAIPITPTTGALTMGGWFDYTGGGVDGTVAFGFDYGPHAGAEAFKITVNPVSGYLYLFTQGAGGMNYSVTDPMSGAISYPVTVRVEDSIGQHATSDQRIRISHGGTLVPGRYFVVGTWLNGVRTLYIDGHPVRTVGAPASLNRSSIEWITLGRVYSSTAGTNVGCDECFFSRDAAMTAAEVAWLYNGGAGRSHADVVAAAA